MFYARKCPDSGQHTFESEFFSAPDCIFKSLPKFDGQKFTSTSKCGKRCATVIRSLVRIQTTVNFFLKKTAFIFGFSMVESIYLPKISSIGDKKYFYVSAGIRTSVIVFLLQHSFFVSKLLFLNATRKYLQKKFVPRLKFFNFLQILFFV